MEPSWEDLPLTVKVTPLGALDLTSRDAADELAMLRRGQGAARRTRAGVVEVLVQELSGTISFVNSFLAMIFAASNVI